MLGNHCNVLLQINPYYGKTSDRGVLEHLSNTLSIGPGFIYNVPGRTGQDISTDVMQKLAESENFIGVKECAGNERIDFYEQRGIACWSGNDDESFDSRHTFKSHGVISVTSNIIPGIMRKLMNENLPELNQSVQGLMNWLFCEPNPIAINTCLMMNKVIPAVFRLPYVPLNLEQRQEGLKLLQAIDRDELLSDKLVVLNDEDFKITV